MSTRARGDRPWVLLLALSAVGCGGDAPVEVAADPVARPSVVLVTWDTVRDDRVGCERDGVACTPTFSSLVGSGVRFSTARAPTPETLPSHASLMTGLYPARHGARANGSFQVDPDVTTLAERFQAAGYRTAAMVSAPVLARASGIAQGFEVFDDRSGAAALPYRAGAETMSAALEWLGSVPPEQPVLLWVHLFDAHQPLVPSLSELRAARGDAYQAQIHLVDAETKRLMERLTASGRADQTLVLITADHGEDLGDHGEHTHSIFAYDATVRVPMLWWWGEDVTVPAMRGTVRDDSVSLVDVAPTLTDLIGLPAAETDGVSLVGPMQGRALSDRTVLVESVTPVYALGTEPIFGFITPSQEAWFAGAAPERYLLESDPGQQENRFSSADTAKLQSLMASAERRWPPEGATELDGETRAQLEALGYVGRGKSVSQATGTARSKTATLDFAMRGFDDAETLLSAYRQVRTADGPSAHLESAALRALDGMGARRAAEALMVDIPSRADEYRDRQATRQKKQALARHIRDVVLPRAEPARAADAWFDLGVTLEYLEDLDGAEAALRQALELRADDQSARAALARVVRSRGAVEEAIALVSEGDATAHCELGRLSSLTDNDARTRTHLVACAEQGGTLGHRDVRVLSGLLFPQQ